MEQEPIEKFQKYKNVEMRNGPTLKHELNLVKLHELRLLKGKPFNDYTAAIMRCE